MRLLRPFLVLSLAAAACSGEGPVATATIAGRVAIGPFCPVERLGSPCPTPPIAAEVRATRPGESEPVAATRTASDGAFRLAVPPGDYELTAEAPNAMFCRPASVRVADRETATVTIDCDTGIR